MLQVSKPLTITPVLLTTFCVSNSLRDKDAGIPGTRLQNSENTTQKGKRKGKVREREIEERREWRRGVFHGVCFPA